MVLVYGVGVWCWFMVVVYGVLCVVGFGGIITVTYSLDIGAGMRSL
jgi:hypothetical protein